MKVLAVITGVGALAGTALAGGTSGCGLVVLDQSMSGALTMSGNSEVDIPTQAVYVNSSDSRAVRPNRSAPSRASRPPVCHRWYHRDAVCADTPNWVTTSTCRNPASNNSTARIRRSRNAFTSRRTLRRGPDDQVGTGMTMIVIPANGIDRQRLTQNTKDL